MAAELTDFLALRECPTCGGEDWYFDGRELQERRLAIWGKRSLRRMARELGIPPSTLRDLEAGRSEWTEDRARAYLVALGDL